MSLIRRAIIFIFFLIGSLFGVHAPETPVPAIPAEPVATTTVSIATTTEKIVAKPKATTTPPTKPKAKAVVKPVVLIPPPAPLPIVTPVPKPVPDFEKINTYARNAIVNIICSSKGNELSPASGTGVLINKNGLILTNAHVAQYFLLQDYHQKDFIECVIRTGSPAYPRYHAELVYISPKWVENNKAILKEENPTGTGENDFAFLRITDAIDGSPLPSFNYILPNTREYIEKNESVILVSYPAGFLGGISILQDLNVTSAVTTVQGLSTFDTGTIDVISVGGTVVSQKGSSGGAVIDKNTTLIGTLSTSSESPTTGGRELYAITPAYINRALQSELGITLGVFLAQDLPAFAKTFQTKTAPLLTKLLTDELNKR